jgi:hypothetical protein
MRVNARGTVVAAAAGMLALVLTGCGAGQDAATALNLPSVPGVNVDAADGSVLVRNAMITYQREGYPVGGEAPVRVWLVNQTDRPVSLVDASSQLAGVVTVDGGAEVAPGGVLELTLRAGDLRQPVAATGSLPLSLGFDNGVELTMRVPMAPPLRPEPRLPMDLGDGH